MEPSERKDLWQIMQFGSPITWGEMSKKVKNEPVKYVPCTVASILKASATAADKTERIIGAKSAQGKKFKYQLR